MGIYVRGNYIYIVNTFCGENFFIHACSIGLCKLCFSLESLKGLNVCVITRDPYTRLEEFYTCNKQLWPTFEEFIDALALGYSNDQILLQSNILENWKHAFGKFSFKKFKMEKGFQMGGLVYPKPGSIASTMTWTRKMRRIVNEYYARDFVIYGYSQIS